MPVRRKHVPRPWQYPNSLHYLRVAVDEQVEVLALTGNLALKGDEHPLHAHVVLGLRDGTALGGHLLEGFVRPTLEVMVIETPRICSGPTTLRPDSRFSI